MAEELPPAVLDLVVNFAEWVEGLQSSISALTDLDAAITDTMAVVDDFAAAMDVAAADTAAAMESAAGAVDEASASIAASADAAAASMERLGAAADESAAAQGAAAEKTKGFAASSLESGSVLGSVADEIGSIAQKVGLAVGAIGVTSLVAAGDFQKAMTQLVTSAGESKDKIGMVSQGLLDMSTQVGFTAVQLGKAMYPIDSATYHAADSLTIMKAAAQGAKDENADLTVTASALTTVMRDYNIPVADAADTMSKMVTAVSFGKTTLQDLSKAMANLLPVAEGAHLQFADVASVFAEMTSKGTPAAKAALDIQNAIRSLEAPTGTMIKQLGQFGLTVHDVQTHLDQDGLGGTLQWLQQVAEKNAASMGETVTGAMKKLIGTAPGLQAILETTGGSFADVQKAEDAVNKSMADAQGNVVGFSEVQGNLNFMMDQFKAQLEKVAISIGNAMMPAVVNLLKMLDGLFTSMSNNHDVADGFKSIIDTIGDAIEALKPTFAPLMATFKDLAQVVGPLLVDVLKLFAPTLAVNIQAFDDMLNSIKPILPYLSSMADLIGKALGQSFKEWWDIMKPILPVFSQFLVDTFKGIFALVPILADFNKGTAELDQGVGNVIDSLVKAGDTVAQWINDIPKNIVKAFQDIAQAIGRWWGNAMDTLKRDAQFAVDAVTTYFKDFPQKLGYSIGYAAGTVLREASNMGKNLVAGVQSGITTFQQWWYALPGMIQGWLSDANKWLTNTGVQILNGLLDGIRSAVTAIQQWWYALPGVIQGWVSDAKNWLINTGSDLINGLVDGVKQKMMDIWNTMTSASPGGGVYGTVISPFNNAASWLNNAGSDIIHGIWSGMVNSFNWLMNNIASFADSIKQGFMSALHINSPSKVMADVVGSGIVEGIAAGMTGNVHLIHQAIGTVKGSLLTGFGGLGASPVSLGLPGGAAGLAVSGGSGGILVINNNVQGSVVAEKEIQRLNQTQTLRYNLRNPTNGLSLFGRGSV